MPAGSYSKDATMKDRKIRLKYIHTGEGETFLAHERRGVSTSLTPREEDLRIHRAVMRHALRDALKRLDT
ncbi:MAG: hypothetical protein M3340_14785 [Actinomycetota bacterium]|nr:hypothetical protein [Actinomycetota bacterium]